MRSYVIDANVKRGAHGSFRIVLTVDGKDVAQREEVAATREDAGAHAREWVMSITAPEAERLLQQAGKKPARMRRYILEIEALDGEERTIGVTDRDCEPCRVFAVIGIGPGGAAIIDNGYTTREEAREAWPEAG